MNKYFIGISNDLKAIEKVMISSILKSLSHFSNQIKLYREVLNTIKII